MTYTSSSFTPSSHKKSFGSQLKSDLIFMIVASFIVYMIQRFFVFLFSPFKAVDIASRGMTYRDYIEERQKAREAYLEAVSEDVNDPMYQFQDRFIDHPEKYLRHRGKDNKVYKDWYDNWKKGLVLDTELRWAPEMYTRDDTIRVSFIDYMKIQLVLHRKASYFLKNKFLKTIRAFYPEFTATFRGLESDLARYELSVTEDNLKKELAKEINKYGLPEDIAEYLSEQDLSVEDLRKQAELLKPLVSKGLSKPTCVCALENDLDLEQAKVVDMIVTKMDLPARVGLAFLREELTSKDLEELYTRVMEAREDLGSKMFTVREGETQTYWNVFIDQLLDNYKSQTRAKKYA
jgi:hypothetical protein